MIALTVNMVVAAHSAESNALRLPAIFSDRMVLLSDCPVPVWGWAPAGQIISVKIADQAKTATTGADGRWQVTLDPLPAGGPYEMAISGPGKRLIKDILAGEVWLGSGQSNMAWPVKLSARATAEIAAARYPSIRFFTVAFASHPQPLTDCQGEWRECSPDSVPDFSATAYFFGRRIHDELKVPVGLIVSAEGGTPIDVWMSRESCASHPDLEIFLQRFATYMAEYPGLKVRYDKLVAFLEERKPLIGKSDAGWEMPDFDDGAWQTAQPPHSWVDLGLSLEGVVWYRRMVEIPLAWSGKDLTLRLGCLDQADVTYFDGYEVGRMDTWQQSRSYQIPGKYVAAGKHLLAIRLLKRAGTGGMSGTPADYRLDGPAGDAIPLAGEWKYQLSDEYPATPHAPVGPGSSWLPTGLFNGMIAPLIPYAIRGVLWYQGEFNITRAKHYQTAFPALIRDWRAKWGIGNFPFLFVQLPCRGTASPDPGDSACAEMRDSQFRTLAEPATGMATIIDLGEAEELHPQNKQEVGWRLAQWALARTYGKAIVPSGPLYHGMKIAGGAIHLEFDHCGGGLISRDHPQLRGFTIAGEDRRFVWAEARIEGSSIIVSSPLVPAPVAARYAWAENPEGCNLFNREGFPASPFRTDDWPVTTEYNR